MQNQDRCGLLLESSSTFFPGKQTVPGDANSIAVYSLKCTSYQTDN